MGISAAMGLAFHNVRAETVDARLAADFSLPNGVVIGVTGPDPAELELFAALADGRRTPDEGAVERGSLHLAGTTFSQIDPLRLAFAVRAALESDAETIALGPGLAVASPLLLEEVQERIFRLRQAGRLIVVVSQQLAWLERIADETLVIEDGEISGRGDPAATLAAYRKRVAERLRREAAPAGLEEGLSRRGDGRAQLITLELLGEDGGSTARLRSGEPAAVRVRLRFEAGVDDPVVGILIRNRVGVTVYGTNTELERLRLGPVRPGDEIGLRFAFRCDLCPHEYTLTAAAHDPDGVAHDWLEEALLFTVVDDRSTAGVANLRARVTLERDGRG